MDHNSSSSASQARPLYGRRFWIIWFDSDLTHFGVTNFSWESIWEMTIISRIIDYGKIAKVCLRVQVFLNSSPVQ